MTAGRPRAVADTAILRATADVMGRTGPSAFTLAVVARAVGLAPATLVQRFGSKRGLLLALARQSVDDATALAAQGWPRREPALTALTAFATASTAPSTLPMAASSVDSASR